MLGHVACSVDGRVTAATAAVDHDALTQLQAGGLCKLGVELGAGTDQYRFIHSIIGAAGDPYAARVRCQGELAAIQTQLESSLTMQ